MSAPAFTPGPWCWQQCGDKVDAPVVGVAFLETDTDCKNPLSGCLPDFDEHGHELAHYRETIAFEIQSCDGCSASANAALIAAAPELYDGCNAMLGLVQLILGRDDLTAELREVLTTNHRIAEAEAATAKARGAQ